MADLKKQFEAAVANSKNLTERPDNATLLKIYALYKQASYRRQHGEKKPGFVDMVGRAKWDAWNGNQRHEHQRCHATVRGSDRIFELNWPYSPRSGHCSKQLLINNSTILGAIVFWPTDLFDGLGGLGRQQVIKVLDNLLPQYGL
jgi:diazepam-binding inhibitor (GABA receptor modulating acyl-CoA-binding protein)